MLVSRHSNAVHQLYGGVASCDSVEAENETTCIRYEFELFLLFDKSNAERMAKHARTSNCRVQKLRSNDRVMFV
jgi:hypothetical protein